MMLTHDDDIMSKNFLENQIEILEKIHQLGFSVKCKAY